MTSSRVGGSQSHGLPPRDIIMEIKIQVVVNVNNLEVVIGEEHVLLVWY